MKHEWRKKEKVIYLPKSKPEIITVPEYKFLTIEGKGNPNSALFSKCIGALYSISYAIKMTLKKKDVKPDEYYDYTVYPLEGVWDINEEAKKSYEGRFDKDDLVYKLMIRQPDFIDDAFFEEMVTLAKEKKQNELLIKVKFEKITDSKCVQMMHLGSYGNEPESFKLMESFAVEQNLHRISKVHREIYLSDFRKVTPEKLKTTLRFQVKNIE